jgi:peroxiredoxin
MRPMYKLIILMLLGFSLSNTALAQSTSPTGLKVGDIAPAIEGIDQHGKPVSLTQLIKKGPVVVTFYRGFWCPFCTKYLKKLQDSLATSGGRVIAVTPETQAFALKIVERSGVTYPIVSDTDGHLLAAYKVGFAVDEATLTKYKSFGLDLKANNGGRAELPVPATYVVGSNGKITFVHFNADYKERADMNSLHSSVE